MAPSRVFRPVSPSWSASSDPKDANGARIIISSSKRQPLWKRLLTGDANEQYETHRGMDTRHIMMIALGGTIGTGIFLSAGSTVALAGPASALLSYFVVGVFCYAVVISLGEMASYIPISGTFAGFATRFVSPAMGFTLGWNYWLQWSLSIPSELLAASIILQYWAPKVQAWQWSLVVIIPIFAMQLIHVRVYGESEYWFALIKVIMIVLFIIVGLIYDWGGIRGHPGPGLSNFRSGQAFIGGFGGFAQTFVWAFYSYGGVELVALAAGETAKPHKAVPRAVRATFFRILIFYVLAILTIGLCVNHADETLLNSAYNSDVTASPITIVFQRAGFGAAVHVVNAVLLTAVLSATNSCFYASSRMLLSLARLGQAPSVFAWVNRRGVPVPALLMSLLASFLTFLTTIWGSGIVFTWLLNLVGISALLVWGSIGVISLRFRMAFKRQGRPLSDLPYTQPLFPVLPVMTIVLALLMFAAQGWAAVRGQEFNWRNVVATYIGVALYLILYISYSLYHHFSSPKPSPHFIPLLEVDLDSDAVWGKGEGDKVRQMERDEKEEKVRMEEENGGGRYGVRLWLKRAGRHVY